jgi:hypothetical protein
MSFRRMYFDEMGIQERIEGFDSVCFLFDIYLNFCELFAFFGRTRCYAIR